MKQCHVLFVCLGNICRSPLAEGIFRHMVGERGLDDRFVIDSCGTGSWHVGNPPHPDSQRVAQKNGVSLNGQVARQASDDDFVNFDYIVAMDRSNLEDLRNIQFGSRSKLFCLREYDPVKGDLDVPDPYYGGRNGFEGVYDIISRSCELLLDDLEQQFG